MKYIKHNKHNKYNKPNMFHKYQLDLIDKNCRNEARLPEKT